MLSRWLARSALGCARTVKVPSSHVQSPLVTDVRPSWPRFFSLQMESMVQVADNCGVRQAKVIKNLGGSWRKSSSLGDFVVIAVQKRDLNRKLVKKNIYLALIVGVRQKVYRKLYGYHVQFANNRVVVLNDQGKMLGTRIKGPVCLELRQRRLAKLVSVAKALV